MAEILWKDNNLLIIHSRVSKDIGRKKKYSKIRFGTFLNNLIGTEVTVLIIPKKAELDEIKNILQKFLSNFL